MTEFLEDWFLPISEQTFEKPMLPKTWYTFINVNRYKNHLCFQTIDEGLGCQT